MASTKHLTIDEIKQKIDDKHDDIKNGQQRLEENARRILQASAAVEHLRRIHKVNNIRRRRAAKTGNSAFLEMLTLTHQVLEPSSNVMHQYIKEKLDENTSIASNIPRLRQDIRHLKEDLQSRRRQQREALPVKISIRRCYAAPPQPDPEHSDEEEMTLPDLDN